uniref:Uncharacterized protein n=1 Tax=mine drainage metagenome TaxID=410659 RepID=E6QB22_9ZZZZ
MHLSECSRQGQPACLSIILFFHIDYFLKGAKAIVRSVEAVTSVAA